MYLDVKGESFWLMIFSVYIYIYIYIYMYIYSISCIIMVWWWPKLGADTSHHLINTLLQMCSYSKTNQMHYFLKFIFGIERYMFQTVSLSIIRSLALHTQQYADCLLASSQHSLYDIYSYLLLCVQWITPDDGQRYCTKHAVFYSKNKFEKLVHLVGLIIRIYNAAWFSECQIHKMWWLWLEIFFRSLRSNINRITIDLCILFRAGAQPLP
jgi:hypothetical protein